MGASKEVKEDVERIEKLLKAERHTKKMALKQAETVKKTEQLKKKQEDETKARQKS